MLRDKQEIEEALAILDYVIQQFIIFNEIPRALDLQKAHSILRWTIKGEATPFEDMIKGFKVKYDEAMAKL